MASLMFTSPSYPQGNGINESSHRMLMHTVKARASVEVGAVIEELVSDATVAFNATPKSDTGQSPFFVITGQEMCLPGMAPYMEQTDEVARKATVTEMRFRALVKSEMTADKFEQVDDAQYAVGDVVLRELSPYERENHSGIVNVHEVCSVVVRSV
eukprot:GHVS01104252.1.p2 GENE.GHVS01104252.1~~GHVS01104252.1.p2  ORF type:complete len:156 (+),score=17.92 GHVS01104252.1:1-468(+)